MFSKDHLMPRNSSFNQSSFDRSIACCTTCLTFSLGLQLSGQTNSISSFRTVPTCGTCPLANLVAVLIPDSRSQILAATSGFNQDPRSSKHTKTRMVKMLDQLLHRELNVMRVTIASLILVEIRELEIPKSISKKST